MNSSSTPCDFASRATWPRVRTTPLTCGCQASVTTIIFMKSSRFCRRRPGDRRFSAVTGTRPGDDLKPAVMAFGNPRAAFDPVATIDVAQTVVVMHGGRVDVSADYAVGLMVSGLGGKSFLEGADIIDRVLDFKLGPFRKRPIRCTEHASERVEDSIGRQGKLVGLVAKKREPARLRHNKVEDIAMDHEITAAVDGLVDGVFHDFDSPEMRAVIAAQEFIMIAGDIDDT